MKICSTFNESEFGFGRCEESQFKTCEFVVNCIVMMENVLLRDLLGFVKVTRALFSQNDLEIPLKTFVVTRLNTSTNFHFCEEEEFVLRSVYISHKHVSSVFFLYKEKSVTTIEYTVNRRGKTS